MAHLRPPPRTVKIALATDWFAPRRGGIETQLQGLARGLAARGHQVDVITSTPGAVDGDGYRVRRLTSGTLPLLDLALTPGLIGELRQLVRVEYDVVHAHVSVVSPVAYGAAMVAARRRLPTVVSFHSVLRAKRALLRLANAALNLDGSAVQWAAVSRSVASQLQSALPRADIAILPNGIDLAFWQPVPRVIPHEDVRFISAMRLHAKKRPRELLQAFGAAVSGGAPSASLVFVGAGPEERALRRDASQLGLLASGRVRFEPWASASALRALYADCDAFVSACDREAFGIAALEARATGLPVIAMREAGSSMFLRDEVDALLCDDLPQVTHAIARFAADRPLRQSLRGAPARLDDYDWPAVVQAHEAAYAVAMQRATGAPTVAP